MNDVTTTIANMCEYNMTQNDEHGDAHILKPTKLMTNSQHIAAQPSRRCKRSNRHIPLIGGRAAAAQIYPPALCKAILRGLREHLQAENIIDEYGHANVCNEYVQHVADHHIELYVDARCKTARHKANARSKDGRACRR